MQKPTVRRSLRRPAVLLAAGGALALGLSACGGGETGEDGGAAGDDPTGANGAAGADTPDQDALATADLLGPDGSALGTVTMTQADGGTEFDIAAEGMEPGMYGFHVHEIGECEPDSAAPDYPEDTGDFMSAGSHIPGEDDADHPDHAGDMPTLLVNDDGTGTMTVVTDRLTESELLDEDGAAIMVHSEPDNFGNIPERYAEDGPDEDTLSTGDAGDRLACGVIEG